MGSIIADRIDYNGVGALRSRSAAHTQQTLTQVQSCTPTPFPLRGSFASTHIMSKTFHQCHLLLTP